MLLGTELLFTDDRGKFNCNQTATHLMRMPLEKHDFHKRPLVHVANTEQRIVFEEVTLIPKLDEQSPQGQDINTEGAAPRHNQEIDTLTGVTAPTRARGRRNMNGSAPSGRAKARRKTTSVSSKKSAKAKGKRKAKDDSDEDISDEDHSDSSDFDGGADGMDL